MHVLFGTVLALNDEALGLIGLIAAVTLAGLGIFWRRWWLRMPRSAVPALGVAAGLAGAFRVPGAGGAQSRRRVPGARRCFRSD